MSAEPIVIPPVAEPIPQKKKKTGTSTLSRVLKYSGVRLVILFFTVVVGIYLTVLIANMGGYVDTIRRAEIRENVNAGHRGDRSFQLLPQAERDRIQAEEISILEEELGLNKPFMVRSFGYVINALSLNLGFAERMNSDSGSRQVRLIILERLPATLVLFATADMILFFSAIFIALFLSRRYGSILDKAIIALAPISTAPGWFFGIFLILIFAALLGILPFGGMVDAPPPSNAFLYALSLAKHMILPVLSISVAHIALNAYNWRTFFLIYSSEDYVEMAKAKGLSSRDVERRYILRPTLPTILTSFSLLIIGLWTGAPIFETVFNWPGLGRATFVAIGLYDTPVIVGTTIIFAYLLAITVFLLEFAYALVDPRVKVGGEGSKA
jgi:peptide/nickel transport system permease protein